MYLDASASGLTRIAVSAGVRGTQLLLDPADYVRAVKATVVAIAKVKRVKRAKRKDPP